MKAGKLQRGMLLSWFSRGHVVLPMHSHNTTDVYFRATEKFITIILVQKV